MITAWTSLSSSIRRPLGAGTTGCQTLAQPGFVDIRKGYQVYIQLVLEIMDMLRADKTVTDETDLNTVIGAQNLDAEKRQLSMIRKSRRAGDMRGLQHR